MESVEKIADKVVDEARTRTGTHLCLDDEWDELRNHIAAALRAERAKLEKFAAFAGPNGEPMPVVGALPVTADHCIVIPWLSTVFHPNHGRSAMYVDVDSNGDVTGQIGVPCEDGSGTDWYEYPICECYAKVEAAEAAAEGKK